MGKVYSGFFELGEFFKTIHNQSFITKEELGDAHDQRWAYGHVPFFAAAYMLDPEYHSHNQMSNPEVVEGWMDTLEKLAILVEVRAQEKADGR